MTDNQVKFIAGAAVSIVGTLSLAVVGGIFVSRDDLLAILRLAMTGLLLIILMALIGFILLSAIRLVATRDDYLEARRPTYNERQLPQPPVIIVVRSELEANQTAIELARRPEILVRR